MVKVKDRKMGLGSVSLLPDLLFEGKGVKWTVDRLYPTMRVSYPGITFPALREGHYSVKPTLHPCQLGKYSIGKN